MEKRKLERLFDPQGTKFDDPGEADPISYIRGHLPSFISEAGCF
jgi:hypothetical protein